MTALLPLLLSFAQVAAPPVTAPVVTMPPADWSTLEELQLLRRWPVIPELSTYVHDEVAAGRCASTAKEIRVDLAVLVAANGQVRRIVPRAIQCPTVEQYASGLISRMARGNVVAPGVDTWFHAAMTFSWP